MNWIRNHLPSSTASSSSSSGGGSHAEAATITAISSRRRSPREKLASDHQTLADSQEEMSETTTASVAKKSKGRKPSLSRHRARASNNKDVKEEPTWTCHNCAYNNRPDDLRCPKCNARKLRSNTSSAVKEEDEEEQYNPDECFICYDGGLLVCCDYCDKSFHNKCHIPPLQDIPTGKWKCCECTASSYSKRYCCGQCEACLREDCGKCMYCLDRSKFGGPNILKQVCINRACPNKRYAKPAKVSPEEKKVLLMAYVKEEDKDEQVVSMLNIKEEEGGGGVVSALFSSGQKPAGKRKHQSSGRDRLPSNSPNDESMGSATSRRSKKISRKAPSGANIGAGMTAPPTSESLEDTVGSRPLSASPAAAAKSKNHSATNNNGFGETSSTPASAVAAKKSSDNPSTINNTVGRIENKNTIGESDTGGNEQRRGSTTAMAADKYRGQQERGGNKKPADSIEVSVGDGLDDDVYSQATTPFLKMHGDEDAGDSDIPNDLAICQMELRRARAENKRQEDEIRRLKSAVRALTASLTG